MRNMTSLTVRNYFKPLNVGKNRGLFFWLFDYDMNLLLSDSSLKMSISEKETASVFTCSDVATLVTSNQTYVTKPSASRKKQGGGPGSVLRLPDPSDDNAIRKLNWGTYIRQWAVMTRGLNLIGKI